jgi:hypothetical protein
VLASFDSLAHRREVVEHAPSVAKVPEPTSNAIGSADAKFLGSHSDDLKQQLAGRIGVVIGGEDGLGVKATIVVPWQQTELLPNVVAAGAPVIARGKRVYDEPTGRFRVECDS